MDGSGIVRKSEKVMPAFSSTTLKIEDLGSEFQFTVTRKSGWVGLAVAYGLIATAITYGVLSQRYFFLMFGVVGAAATLVNWVKGPVTVLRVSDSRVLATGNLERWSDSDFEISADQVKSIGWSYGGQQGNSGLFVSHGLMGLGGTCVLPGLSKEQARQVTDAIALKFPRYKLANVSAGGFEISLGS